MKNYLRSEPPGYWKAMQDFNITVLLQHLEELTRGECDRENIPALAALLVKHLVNLLHPETLAPYCHALNNEKAEECDRVLSVARCLPLPADSPAFVLDAKPPEFPFGMAVRWIPLDDLMPPDFGIVLGRFYGYMPERSRWSWCYVILLDPDSPSARWCDIDAGWECDLERWYDE